MQFLLPVSQLIWTRLEKARERFLARVSEDARVKSHLCSGAPRRAREALLQATAYYLRLPTGESRQWLRDNRRFLAQVEARRKRQQSAWRLRRHRNRWYASDLEAYRQLLAQDPRSRIVATYHFGDFAFGLNCLLREDPQGRECIVLTQQTSDAAYFANMRRAFGDEATTVQQQWPVARLRSSNLSAKLRKQSVTLVTFCDLPPGFGATTGVQFLGRRASFPRGAAALAVRYELPLLPVVCYHSAGKHRVAFSPQIEPLPSHGEGRVECISRLTQQLTNTLQGFVRWAPQQWRFLGSLPSYFANTSERDEQSLRLRSEA